MGTKVGDPMIDLQERMLAHMDASTDGYGLQDCEGPHTWMGGGLPFGGKAICAVCLLTQEEFEGNIRHIPCCDETYCAGASGWGGPEFPLCDGCNSDGTRTVHLTVALTDDKVFS